MTTKIYETEVLEPGVEKQQDILASTIEEALVKAGIISPQPQPLTEFQLIYFLDQMVDHYVELCAANNETK
jgi:hypothetical protein